MKKKFLSIFIVFIMSIGIMPGRLDAVFAADAYDGYVTISIEDYGIRSAGAWNVKYENPLGKIAGPAKVGFYKGENIAQVTLRFFQERGIAYEYSGSISSSFYLSSMGNFTAGGTYVDSLGEFDCGPMSGWMMTLNNWFVNQGASSFSVEEGDLIKWKYTCQLGEDIGSSYNNPSAKIIGLEFEGNGILEPEFDRAVSDYVYYVALSANTVSLEAKMENYGSQVTYTSNGKTYKPLAKIPVSDGTVIELDSRYFKVYTDLEPFDTDKISITIRKKEEIDSEKPTHSHSMAKTAAKSPTGTENGNIEYYTCTECGRVYKDEAGKIEVSKEDTVIPATGTTVLVPPTVPAEQPTQPAKQPTQPAKVKFSRQTVVYTGKAIQNSLKVTDAAGKVVSPSFYTVKYKGNKNVGTAVAVVTFRGKYAKFKALTAKFKIVPKGTSIKQLVKGKKQIKAVWKPQKKQITGYQLQYSTNKKFTSKTTKSATAKAGKTSFVMKRLKAKKTYYVRIRTYKTVGKKKYYSSWSIEKKKKTK